MAWQALLPADVSMALAHDCLRFALISAPALVQSTEGDDVRRALIADYYSTVLCGLEVHHHGEEELLFPLLVDRFPDEQEKVHLGAKQHHDVLSFLASAEAAVSAWEREGDSERGSVISALADLAECLSVHLDYEESMIVPLEARLTLEDRTSYMARVRKHHAARLLPNVAEWSFAFAHGQAFLWESVGEKLFRDMIGKAHQEA